MKRIILIFSALVFIVANVGISQDIINETGKDGKFIVRDTEEQEALVIEDGNVGITGELSVEQLPEGKVSNPYVVWDPEDKKFKTVARLFSKVSPLSEPLGTGSSHRIGYGELEEGIDEIQASVQGTAAAWNQFDTDFGYIALGPANATWGHIYTDRNNFLFNKPIYAFHGVFGTYPGHHLYLNTSGDTRIFANYSTGHVGLGKTNPVTDLDINTASTSHGLAFDGMVAFGGTSGNSLIWTNPQSHYDGTYIANKPLYVNDGLRVGYWYSEPLVYKLELDAGTMNISDPPSDIALRVDGAEALWYNGSYFSWGYGGTWNRFADPVRIGIATTAPAQMLEVVTNAGSFGEVAKFHNTNLGTSADGIIIQTGPNTNPTSANEYIQFYDGNGSFIGAIEGDGAGGILWNNPSDRRLKMNIREMNGGLALLSKMNVKRYEMKSAPGKEKIGFIAQELQKVYPMAVGGNPDGDIEKEPMGVDHIALVPILVQAIQELQARIEVLEGR